MKTLVGSSNNIYSAALNTTAKTLTFSNVTSFDMFKATLISVYDSTVALNFVLGYNIVSVTYSYVAGLPQWVYLFTTLPAGAANGDTLVIFINVPDSQAVYSVNLKIAGSTV